MPQGYWTEGRIVNGTNVGGGHFVQGTPPAGYGTPSATATSPISSLTSGNGASTIDKAIVDQKNDLANIATTPSTAATPAPAKKSFERNTALESIGALSSEEATAMGTSPSLLQSQYTYDPNTGYHIPKGSTVEDQTNQSYDTAEKKIIDQFAEQTAGMDKATQNLVNSISGIYSARIADQAEANRRELATFNTMNVRYGTSRYAPGVAQGVLTADERAGLDRVNKIAMEEAGLIAQANQSLTDKKYNAFIAQRNELGDLRKEKINQLQKLQDRADKVRSEKMAAEKDARDFAYKQGQDEILNDLTSKKFSYQQKQDAIDNALKAKQISETQRHNMALEAIQKEPTAKEKAATEAALKNAKASIPVIQEKIRTIDYLSQSTGLETRVGTGILSRTPRNWKGIIGKVSTIVGIPGLISKDIPDKLTGAGQDFAGNVHNILTGLTLRSLIDAKAQGATFGALSDAELELLANSASAINDWEIKDDKGLGTGVWNIDETSFKRELNNIKILMNRALVSSQQSLITPDEQAILDSEFKEDPSIYYSQ